MILDSTTPEISLDVTSGSPAISDTFSFRRMLSVGQYWWPRLKYTFWILLIASLLFGALAGLIDSHFNTFNGSLFCSGFTIACWVAPIIFRKDRGRELNAALPATNSEKVLFMLLCSLVVLPLISIGASTLVYVMLIDFNHMMLMALSQLNYLIDVDALMHLKKEMIVCGVVTTLFYPTVILYYSQTLRRNAVMKSLVIALAFYVGSMLIFMIYPFVEGFRMGMSETPVPIDYFTTHIGKMVLRLLHLYAIGLTAFYAIGTAIYLYLLWRRYPKIQVQ